MKRTGFLLLVTMFAVSPAAAQVQITVFDVDSKSGVAANVFLKNAAKLEQLVASPEADESPTVSHNCQLGDAFYAKPASPAYFQRTPERACSKAVKLPATRIYRVTDISNKASIYSTTNQPGKAAQAYSELNARLGLVSAELQVYKQAGLALGVKEPTTFDPVQNKHVATMELISKVREFQSRNGLDPDGILGGETLAKLAGGSVSRNLK